MPGGPDPNDPYREGGEYSGVDRGNYDLPGYQATQDRYGDYLSQVDNRSAPQLAMADQAHNSAFRGQQSDLASLLMDRAQGNNSVAEQQLRQGLDASNHQQMALMAGARPSNAAMALRLGGQNMATSSMGLTGQAALARAQEANLAANSLGSVLAQGRGADENVDMFNAGQANHRSDVNAQLQQNQTSIDDAARGNLLGGSLQAAGLQQQGGMGYEQNRAGRFGAVLGVPTNQEVMYGGLQGMIKGAAGGG